LIFDFWKNFEWFNMHPEGKEEKPAQAVPTKIFIVRLQQLDYLLNSKDVRSEQVKAKLAEDMNSLPLESVSIKEHMRELEKAKASNFWELIGINQSEFLKGKIAPLMRYTPDVNPDEAYFMLKIEQLSLAILRNSRLEIEALRDAIGEYLNCLPTTINAVKEKQQLLSRVFIADFWTDISYEDAQMLGREFAPLMRYKLPEPRPTIKLDIDDVIQEKEIIEYGLLPSHEYVTTYVQKVEERIRQMADKHPTILKIKRDEVLTEEDLNNLELTLNSPELYITEEILQKVYKQSKGTLVQFIKNVLGMYVFPEPKKRIEEAFKTFMIEKNYLNADQVNFLRTIQTVFTKKHHIEYGDLFEPPFTNFGVNAPIPLFEDEDLKEVIQLCADLEREVVLVSS